jgi:hypothetical protein
MSVMEPPAPGEHVENCPVAKGEASQCGCSKAKMFELWEQSLNGEEDLYVKLLPRVNYTIDLPSLAQPCTADDWCAICNTSSKMQSVVYHLTDDGMTAIQLARGCFKCHVWNYFELDGTPIQPKMIEEKESQE